MATDYGFVILEKRFVDVTRRYGIMEDYIKGWDGPFPSKKIDTHHSLKYHYHNNYEGITLMLVLVIGTTYVTTTTTCTITAYGPIGI